MLIGDGCVGQLLAADGVGSKVRRLTQEKVSHHTLWYILYIYICSHIYIYAHPREGKPSHSHTLVYFICDTQLTIHFSAS
jgi:hypothetical protein